MLRRLVQLGTLGCAALAALGLWWWWQVLASPAGDAPGALAGVFAFLVGGPGAVLLAFWASQLPRIERRVH